MRALTLRATLPNQHCPKTGLGSLPDLQGQSHLGLQVQWLLGLMSLSGGSSASLAERRPQSLVVYLTAQKGAAAIG